VPNPKLTIGLRVNVDEETALELGRLAEAEERSIAAVIRRSIRHELAAASSDGRLVEERAA